MTAAFVLLAVLTLTSAVASVTLRNLVHCALALTLAFAGVAGLYMTLGAQFVGFAQILVYIGAVAILVVFAILLTRGSEPDSPRPRFAAGWAWGVGVSVAVFATIAAAVLWSPALPADHPALPQAPVRQIGDELMTRYVVALELIGLLLTVAMIGAVILALKEPRSEGRPG